MIAYEEYSKDLDYERANNLERVARYNNMLSLGAYTVGSGAGIVAAGLHAPAALTGGTTTPYATAGIAGALLSTIVHQVNHHVDARRAAVDSREAASQIRMHLASRAPMPAETYQQCMTVRTIFPLPKSQYRQDEMQRRQMQTQQRQMTMETQPPQPPPRRSGQSSKNQQPAVYMSSLYNGLPPPV